MSSKIYAPGIKVNEMDRSGYDYSVDNSVNGTNVLVLGFADKGDNYNVKWINSEATFKHLYGTPKTEAERYFYNAAMEVVDGGGTCYAAKLPYTNNSLNNFVYTSYTISNEATPIYSPIDIIQNRIFCGIDEDFDDIVIKENLSSMIDSVQESIRILNLCDEFKEKISENEFLRDGFHSIDDKTVNELVGAYFSVYNIINNTNLSYIHNDVQTAYEYMKTVIENINNIDIINMYSYIFFIYRDSILRTKDITDANERLEKLS